MPMFGDICGKFFFDNVKYPRLLTPFQVFSFFCPSAADESRT
jgi:hypothetical protein